MPQRASPVPTSCSQPLQGQRSSPCNQDGAGKSYTGVYTITWSSSSTAVARVSSTAVLTGAGNGAATISYYATWGQVYAATYGDAIACAAGSPVMESYADDPSGYAFPQGNWGHLMTALSFAVDHIAPGAAEGYARVTGASNWASNASKFNDWPQYGIVPR